MLRHLQMRSYKSASCVDCPINFAGEMFIWWRLSDTNKPTITPVPFHHSLSGKLSTLRSLTMAATPQRGARSDRSRLLDPGSRLWFGIEAFLERASPPRSCRHGPWQLIEFGYLLFSNWPWSFDLQSLGRAARPHSLVIARTALAASDPFWLRPRSSKRRSEQSPTQVAQRLSL